jgi:hypothetical protein
MVGGEVTYGGKGPDRLGYLIEGGFPIYKGEFEFDVLLAAGSRQTADHIPVHSTYIPGYDVPYTEHKTYNVGNQSLFIVSPSSFRRHLD